MADKNKEKEVYYFKIIPKEEFPKFIERLKEALEKIDNKKNDKKYFEFEIRGTKEEPNGLTLEIFSFDENKYEEFIVDDQEYINNSLLSISLNLSAKEETGVEKLKELFNNFKPAFENIPVIKDKSEFLFRSKGREVSFDLVIKEGKLIQILLDLGIDFTEYHRFNLALLTGINIYDLLHESENITSNFIKIYSLIFSIRSESENFRYLLIALSEALKEVKINNKAIQKKFDKFVNFLRFLNSFIKNKIKLEYDAKILAGQATKDNENKLQQYIALVQGMGIPLIQGFGFTDVIKSTDIDQISINLIIPKYKNGFTISLKIPGLSNALDELFDNYEKSISK